MFYDKRLRKLEESIDRIDNNIGYILKYLGNPDVHVYGNKQATTFSKLEQLLQGVHLIYQDIVENKKKEQ